MAIESTTSTIYNPAAAVNTVSKQTSGGAASSTKQSGQREEAVKVEISPQISSSSRMKAANGDANLSAETLAAISNGKFPPEIIPQEVPAQAAEVAAETAAIQEANNTGQPVESIDVEALAQAAQAFAQANSLIKSQPAVPANVEAITSAPAASSSHAAPVQDTATAALGNTVDTTA